MDERELNSRLSRISTIWSLVEQADPSAGRGSRSAVLALIQRYQGAVYRYLLGAVRNADAADELFQEFALKLTQGAFRAADPQRGRFRNYLKSALYHLIVDYQKRARKEHRGLDAANRPAELEVCVETLDTQFLAGWREEMLSKAWTALQTQEHQSGQPYHFLLKMRAEHPDDTSTELASRLTRDLRPPTPYSETAVRKVLQRARARFADALVDEVSRSLGEPNNDEIERELIDLDLFRYCRSALAKRRTGSDP